MNSGCIPAVCLIEWCQFRRSHRGLWDIKSERESENEGTLHAEEECLHSSVTAVERKAKKWADRPTLIQQSLKSHPSRKGRAVVRGSSSSFQSPSHDDGDGPRWTQTPAPHNSSQPSWEGSGAGRQPAPFSLFAVRPAKDPLKAWDHCCLLLYLLFYYRCFHNYLQGFPNLTEYWLTPQSKYVLKGPQFLCCVHVDSGRR